MSSSIVHPLTLNKPLMEILVLKMKILDPKMLTY